MTEWHLSREDWEEHREAVREIHTALFGSTVQSGILEDLRRHGSELERHDRRMADHHETLLIHDRRIMHLEQAPAMSATDELKAIKAQRIWLGRTTIGEIMRVAAICLGSSLLLLLGQFLMTAGKASFGH